MAITVMGERSEAWQRRLSAAPAQVRQDLIHYAIDAIGSYGGAYARLARDAPGYILFLHPIPVYGCKPPENLFCHCSEELQAADNKTLTAELLNIESSVTVR